MPALASQSWPASLQTASHLLAMHRKPEQQSPGPLQLALASPQPGAHWLAPFWYTQASFAQQSLDAWQPSPACLQRGTPQTPPLQLPVQQSAAELQLLPSGRQPTRHVPPWHDKPLQHPPLTHGSPNCVHAQ